MEAEDIERYLAELGAELKNRGLKILEGSLSGILPFNQPFCTSQGGSLSMSVPTIYSPWAQQPAPCHMSMSQFRLQVHRHLAKIAVFEASSQRIASVLINPHGRLPLSYSDDATATFASLSKVIRDFCYFLEETSQLPLVLRAFSYGFLSSLLFLESQSRLSVALIEELYLI